MTVVFSPELRAVQNLLRERAGLPLLADTLRDRFCGTCELWKTTDDFYPSKNTSECKACCRERKRRWRETNPEKERLANRERKRRARENDAASFVTCKCGEIFHLRHFPRHEGVCSALADDPVDVTKNLWCHRCRQWKPDEEFPNHSKGWTRRKRDVRCRSCKKEQSAKARQAKREAQPPFHSTCVCGKTFTTRGLPTHQRSCRVWLDSQKTDCYTGVDKVC